MSVDFGFVSRVCSAQDLRDASHGVDDGVDLFGGHDAASGDLSKVGFGDGFLGVDLGDPLLDQDGVGAGVERGPVAVELGLAGADLLAGGHCPMLVGVVVLGIDHRLQRGTQVDGCKDALDPRVDEFADLVFAQVDAARVGEPVGVGILGGVGAAVVVAAVVEAADHPAVAQAAEEQTGQDVAALAASWFTVDVGPASAGRNHGLDPFEGVVVDDRLVGEGRGVDPLPGRVPAHLRLVAQRDVVDIDEDLGLTLLVPHLPAGIAGVGEDRRESRTKALGQLSIDPAVGAALAAARWRFV